MGDSFCMTDPEMHTEGQDNRKNRIEGKENAHFQRKIKDCVKHEKLPHNREIKKRSQESHTTFHSPYLTLLATSLVKSYRLQQLAWKR